MNNIVLSATLDLDRNEPRFPKSPFISQQTRDRIADETTNKMLYGNARGKRRPICNSCFVSLSSAGKCNCSE